VSKEHLHCYADVGLNFVKLGERAAVDLHEFSLDGARWSKCRQALHRFDKTGATFRVIEADQVADAMPQLRRVSDAWLNAKAGAEKGFSMGVFDEAYLRRFPVAVVEQGGAIVAFANMWLGAHRDEMCVDLMRYHAEAPKGVMDGLFVHLFVWGKDRGYRWFVLGMAPLSGFERSPVEPLWNRIGAFVYKHAEAVYGFQGLRAYKQKFNPVWEARYLVYPGGLSLPRVLADVSALIAGGYRRIFAKAGQ
jgi:phosphatidylglycerol lysyltransferase